MQNLLLFIIFLFVIAAVFRVDFFFYLLYLFFGVYFLSVLWGERSLRHVVGRREYVDRAFPGERITVRLHVRNGSVLPIPWLRVHESLPIQLKSPSFFRCVLSLLPKERATLTYELDCRRRGYYPIGPLMMSTGDLFGMRTHEGRSQELDHLTVYPRIIPLRQVVLLAKSPFGSVPARQRVYEDPSRMVGVRAYQSGDSLRNIHWKTTAAMGSLQVKRFEPAISIESQLFLNLNRQEYTNARADIASELGIVVAASLASYLIEKRQTVGLCCNGLDPLWLAQGNGAAEVAKEAQTIVVPPRKGREHLMRMLDILARVQMDEEVPFIDLLRQASLHLTWGSTGIIVSGHADEELFDAMVVMQRSGFHVMLVLLDPRTPFNLLQQRAHDIGVQAHQIWQESDLDVWR